jgi:hypothetical protein
LGRQLLRRPSAGPPLAACPRLLEQVVQLVEAANDQGYNAYDQEQGHRLPLLSRAFMTRFAERFCSASMT